MFPFTKLVLWILLIHSQVIKNQTLQQLFRGLRAVFRWMISPNVWILKQGRNIFTLHNSIQTQLLKFITAWPRSQSLFCGCVWSLSAMHFVATSSSLVNNKINVMDINIIGSSIWEIFMLSNLFCFLMVILCFLLTLGHVRWMDYYFLRMVCWFLSSNIILCQFHSFGVISVAQQISAKTMGIGRVCNGFYILQSSMIKAFHVAAQQIQDDNTLHWHMRFGYLPASIEGFTTKC